MKYFLFHLLVFAFMPSYAQFPEYCVYLVRGDVSVVKMNAKPHRVIQKDLIYKDDVITVLKNSEVQLINKEGKYLVLTAPGSYKNADLSTKMQVSSAPGLTKTYFKL